MKLGLHDAYGDPTPAGRRTGIGFGLLTILAVGFGLGRGISPTTAAPAPKPAAVIAQAPIGPVAPAHGPAPHTQAGASTAAAEADCVMGGPLITAPDRYQAALAAVLAPDKVGDAAAIAQQESSQVDQQTNVVSAAAQGTRTYVSCVPLGYRVESYTDSTAAVSVWTVQLVAVEGVYAPASSFVTETLHMVWTVGGWKLETSDLLDTQWAPAPRQTSLPQSSTLPAQMLNFTSFGNG